MPQCIYCTHCGVTDFTKLIGICSEKTKNRPEVAVMKENRCKEYLIAPMDSYRWRVSKLTKGIK